MASDKSPATNIPETTVGGVPDRDKYLPLASVSRIMRDAIPANGKITNEAKKFVQECVSDFIAFITDQANHRRIIESRASITGDDVLQAIELLGFDNYVEPLRLYLQRYREFEGLQMGVQPAAQVEGEAGGSAAIHGGSENPGGQQGPSPPGDNIDPS